MKEQESKVIRKTGVAMKASSTRRVFVAIIVIIACCPIDAFHGSSSAVNHGRRQEMPTTTCWPKTFDPLLVKTKAKFTLFSSSRPQHSSRKSAVSEEIDARNTQGIKVEKAVGPLEAATRKLGMQLFIVSMCVALPISLLPIAILEKSKLVSKTRTEQMSLQAAELCAKWLLRLIPFVHLDVISSIKEKDENPIPTVWVVNHVSQLDTFLLLASDDKLRGKNKRPLKTIYVSAAYELYFAEFSG
jgi:hypothetical protein